MAYDETTLAAKRKALDDILEFALGELGNEVRGRHRPPPQPPAADETAAEAPADPLAEVTEDDLVGLFSQEG